jgi:hypothetical protein
MRPQEMTGGLDDDIVPAPVVGNGRGLDPTVGRTPSKTFPGVTWK